MASCVSWYALNGFACPVSGCAGNRNQYNWICKKCGTTIYIAQTGYLKCESGTHNNQLIKWRFNCGNHSNHPAEYQPPDLQGFTFALSHAVQLMDKAGSEWVGQLCVQIGKQFGR